MRLLLVSDRVHPALYDHFDPTRFPAIDAIISCGDLEAHYLDFLASSFNCPCYFVRGNHDPYTDLPGWSNLDGRAVKIGHLRVLGFEGCLVYSQNKRVQYSQRQMWWKVIKALARTGGRGADLVVTHAPPQGFHEGDDAAHKGFAAFRWLIERFGPRYFAHGHQHLSYAPFQERVTQVGRTALINADGYHVLEV